MKYALIAAMVAISAPAMAENWQDLRMAEGGTISIDLDSIGTFKDSNRQTWRAAKIQMSMADGVRLSAIAFDCRGHAYELGGPVLHIPAGSAAEGVAAVICRAKLGTKG